MSYKNKINNFLVENTPEDSNAPAGAGVTFNIIYRSLDLFSDMGNSVTRVLDSHKVAFETDEEETPQADEEDEKETSGIKKLEGNRKTIIKNIFVIRYLIAWHKAALLHASKLSSKVDGGALSGKAVKKGLISLGKALFGVFESTEEENFKKILPEKIKFSEIQNIAGSIGGEGASQFYKAILNTTLTIPKEAFTGILQNLPDEYKSGSLVTILTTTPEGYLAAYRKTRSKISDTISSLYSDMKDVKRVKAKNRKIRAPQGSGLDDQQAQDLALFDDLLGDDSLEESVSNPRLTMANLNKIKHKLKPAEYNRLKALINNQNAERYIQARRAKKPNKANKKTPASAKIIASLEDIQNLHGHPYDPNKTMEVYKYLQANIGKFSNPKTKMSIASFSKPDENASTKISSHRYPKLELIKAKLAGTQIHGIEYINVVDKKYEVKKDEVALSTSVAKFYKETKIQVSDKNDVLLLDKFFNYIKTSYSSLKEKIDTGYIKDKAGKNIATLIRDFKMEELDDEGQGRFESLAKSQGREISKHIVKLLGDLRVASDNSKQISQEIEEISSMALEDIKEKYTVILQQDQLVKSIAEALTNRLNTILKEKQIWFKINEDSFSIISFEATTAPGELGDEEIHFVYNGANGNKQKANLKDYLGTLVAKDKQKPQTRSQPQAKNNLKYKIENDQEYNEIYNEIEFKAEEAGINTGGAMPLDFSYVQFINYIGAIKSSGQINPRGLGLQEQAKQAIQQKSKEFFGKEFLFNTFIEQFTEDQQYEIKKIFSLVDKPLLKRIWNMIPATKTQAATDAEEKARQIVSDFKRKVADISAKQSEKHKRPVGNNKKEPADRTSVNEDNISQNMANISEPNPTLKSEIVLSEEDVGEIIQQMAAAIREMHRVFQKRREIKLSEANNKWRTDAHMTTQEFMSGYRTKEEMENKSGMAIIMKKILQGATELKVFSDKENKAIPLKINPLPKTFFPKFEQFWDLLRANRLVDEFKQIIKQELAKPQKKKTSESLERILTPLVRKAMRKQWQKRIT